MAAPSLLGRLGLSRLFSTGPLPKATPFKEMGVSGTAIFGGQIVQKERDGRLVGQQKWITFSDLMTNTSIVAAGTRYLLNLVAYSKWTVEPVDDSAEAKKVSEFVEEVINDCTTPWRRITRRAAMYRFHGYGVQEWTAKKRKKDGKIGFDDIESRPCHTIEAWEPDDNGTITGVWQRAPQGGELLFLPRSKILYIVDDTLTDSPEGIGVFRHLIEPWERLKEYFLLEGRGFERDLRGTPIGRAPYTALDNAVKRGELSEAAKDAIIRNIENFVKTQAKSNDTSLVLDSIPYIVDTDTGQSISGALQYGIELLQGGSVGFAEVGAAIDRTVLEMARIIGVENLLLGDKGGGSRALSEDKSQNFYLVVNGALEEICDACNKDIITPLCNLNGIKEEMRPKLKHSDVSFRTVAEITASLAQMATAGAVMRPDDPAINDIRDLLGVSQQPEMTDQDIQLFQQQQQAKAGIKLGADGKPIDPRSKVAPGEEKFHKPPTPPGKFPPKKGQPPAKSGGKGSKGNQDITKFFDLDDIEGWDDDFDKANPNQVRDAKGRWARGFSPSTRFTETRTEHVKPSPFSNVPGLKGKLQRTAEWLKSEPVKEAVKDHVSFLAKESLSHTIYQLLDAVSRHKTDEGLDPEFHGLISGLIHSRSLEGLTLGQARASLSLVVSLLQSLRKSQAEKADQEDPILEILNTIQEAIDQIPDEDIEKAFDPNQPRDQRGRFSRVGGSAGLARKVPGVHPMSEHEFIQAATDFEEQRRAEKEARANTRFQRFKSVINNRIEGVANWFNSKPSSEVLKDHASTLAREGLAQVTAHLMREAARKNDVKYDPRVTKLIERTVLGEAQQKDITLGQARATIKLALNLLKSFRKGQIEKVEANQDDPIVATIDFIIDELDDMDIVDNQIQKIVRFVDEGSGIEIVAEQLDD